MDKNQPHPYILSVLLLGLFLGGGFTAYMMCRTFLPIDLLALLVFVFGGLAIGVHYFFFRKWGRYLAELLLYCILGWGLICTCLFLVINYQFHSSPYIREIKLKRGDMECLGYTQNVQSFDLETNDPEFEGYSYLITFDSDEIASDSPQKAIITEARGLFGFKVILEKELR